MGAARWNYSQDWYFVFEMMCDTLNRSVYVCKQVASTFVNAFTQRNYLGPQRRSEVLSVC